LTEETLSDLCYFLEKVVENAGKILERGEEAISEFADNNIIDSTR